MWKASIVIAVSDHMDELACQEVPTGKSPKQVVTTGSFQALSFCDYMIY